MATYNVREESRFEDKDVVIFFTEDRQAKVEYSLENSDFYLQDKDEDVLEFDIEDLGYLIKALQKLQEVITE